MSHQKSRNFIKHIIFFLIIGSVLIFPQNEKSIHQIESEHYSKHPELIEKPDFQKPSPTYNYDEVKSLSHSVYGFHPYWISDATASAYYYSLLTDVAYFSAEVDNSLSTTGGFLTTRSWSTTQVVNYCKSNGVKIHLAITMFSNHDRVLSNSIYRTNLANNILTQVQLRSADGANIDFESVASAQKDNYRLFIKELGDLLKLNNLELVVELPAVDWSGIYDNTFFTTVNSLVDKYFLMAYDYYWRGSSTAGPVSPLTTGTSIRHVTRSIDAYINAGATSSKLITGLNYYGYEWPVTSSTRMASTTGDAVTKTFSQIKTALSGIPAEDKFFDETYSSPWYRYQNSGLWYQTWYDDSLSLSLKYDAIKAKGCAGTGMWALSYDGSNTNLWGSLKNSFASTSNLSNSILADFEIDAGTFSASPTYSGSTVGISKLSTSARSVEQSYNGWASLKVILKDSSSLSTNWTVRLLSGTGTPSNNSTLGTTGYIGLWLKTSSAPSGAQIAITLDDAAGGTELSPKRNLSNNNEWTLYEWNLQESGWSSFSGGNGIVNGPTVTLDAIMFYAANNSPDWTIFLDDVSYNSNSSLPVNFNSFTAYNKENSIILKWQTATEVNNYGFQVERKTEKVESIWEEIGFVAGSGNSNSPKEYSYTDNSLNNSGKYSYRLKQVDNDGSYEYSSVVEVDYNPVITFELAQNYPNPFNPSTSISYSIPDAEFVNIKVFNLLGEEVATLFNGYMEAGKHTLSFDASKLNSGMYLYKITAGSFTQVKKMLLAK
jgi:spore germination protein YaaH